jgi:hypothetical protein
MLILIGKGYTRQKEGITLKQLDNDSHSALAVSEAINPYYEHLYKLLVEKSYYFAREPTTTKGM